MGERIVCGCEECHPELYDESWLCRDCGGSVGAMRASRMSDLTATRWEWDLSMVEVEFKTVHCGLVSIVLSKEQWSDLLDQLIEIKKEVE